MNVSPAMSYHCNLSLRFCILIVYCEAVRSAILATAWLLVEILRCKRIEVTSLTFRHQYRDHFLAHMPFPNGGSLEPRIYL